PAKAEHSLYDGRSVTKNQTDVLAACSFCDATGARISRAHAVVFQDSIKETGSAAWAIQGLITTLFSMSYYDHVFQFDVSVPAIVASEVIVLRPTSWTFFTLVVSLVAVHLSLVCLVSMIFLLRAEDVFVGSSWAAVARVSGPETDEWLRKASA